MPITRDPPTIAPAAVENKLANALAREPAKAEIIKRDVLANPDNAREWGAVFTASFKESGAMGNAFRTLGARDSGAEDRMKALGDIASTLTAAQVGKLVEAMSANPTGASAVGIVNRIRAERE